MKSSAEKRGVRPRTEPSWSDIRDQEFARRLEGDGATPSWPGLRDRQYAELMVEEHAGIGHRAER